ncbi:MAG: site-specific DNA-methyltransferase [Myxococcales bacterium]|nr:site-specific DNA-methyltransferase [Myxococcales bacterium]
MSTRLNRLLSLLKELFELDQPDLDFGMYRVLRLRSGEITTFLEESLPDHVRGSFARHDDAHSAELAAAESVDRGALESEVYDHLYRFFRRYYQGGDFVSRRVYKDGVYAIPYQGEEVLLHWANKDQFYIKTSEAFRNYSFRLRPTQNDAPMRVHFDLVNADEGEHANVKAAAGKERRFVLAAPGASGRDFLHLEGGELHIRFEYRKHPESQEKLVDAAIAGILGVNDHALTEWLHELGKAQEGTSSTPPPSKLAYRLRSYVARNQRDYFIHKDLGAFLRGELEYFLKCDVLHTDDLIRATSNQLEQRLSTLRVIRDIGEQLITFLAQLEDFQKRLWLKKKFVTETSWCVTLDRIDEGLFGEITACDAQREAWVRLYAIDRITGDRVRAPYSVPLTPAFLHENRSLVLDTRHFSADFTARLLATFGDLDDATDGVLVNSENFQALNLLQGRYSGEVKCVYIDPPYNAKTSKILYKNSFEHSSWVSMMADRFDGAAPLARPGATWVVAIDENEVDRLHLLLRESFPDREIVPVAVVHNPRGIQGDGLSCTNEFAMFVRTRGFPLGKKSLDQTKSKPLMKTGSESTRDTARNCFYPIVVEQDTVVEIGDVPAKTWHPPGPTVTRADGRQELWPISSDGQERKWRYARDSVHSVLDDLEVRRTRDGTPIVYLGKSQESYRTTWVDPEFNAAEHGSTLLKNLGLTGFTFPKSIWTVHHSLCAANLFSQEVVLDYFAGSGTTSHAVINLNREDGGRRKFVLVEMADYFETVLLPRVMKVTYSPEWDAGKPKRAATSEEILRGPGLVKVLRLESYEDTLNNLELRRPEGLDRLLSGPQERATYLVSSLLDTETRGSASLVDMSAFADPTRYLLTVKPPGGDESRRVAVDLVETLNLLLGLRVRRLDAPETFTALTRRTEHGRLEVTRLTPDADGAHWLRAVTGTDPEEKRVLVVWRRLTGDPELDNAVLEHWFERPGSRTGDREFDLICVNGDCTLENLRRDDETWKVRRSEAELVRLMFEASEITRG